MHTARYAETKTNFAFLLLTVWRCKPGFCTPTPLRDEAAIGHLSYNLFNNFQGARMTEISSRSISSREVIHNFSAVAARVAAGEELTVTRYGKPLLKLVQVSASGMSLRDQEVVVRKALAFRMTQPYGKPFERSDAYPA